jgi:hypothetical protein
MISGRFPDTSAETGQITGLSQRIRSVPLKQSAWCSAPEKSQQTRVTPKLIFISLQSLRLTCAFVVGLPEFEPGTS